MEGRERLIAGVLSDSLLVVGVAMHFADSITVLPDKRLRVNKVLSANDPIFKGHFPGLSVYPGVLVMELASEAMSAYAASEYPHARIWLERIVSARYYSPVFPGHLLEMMIRIEQKGDTQLSTDCKVICCEQRMARLKMDFRLEEKM